MGSNVVTRAGSGKPPREYLDEKEHRERWRQRKVRHYEDLVDQLPPRRKPFDDVFGITTVQEGGVFQLRLQLGREGCWDSECGAELTVPVKVALNYPRLQQEVLERTGVPFVWVASVHLYPCEDLSPAELARGWRDRVVESLLEESVVEEKEAKYLADCAESGVPPEPMWFSPPSDHA
jgi:hypothetical protein